MDKIELRKKKYEGVVLIFRFHTYMYVPTKNLINGEIYENKNFKSMLLTLLFSKRFS